ncbi:MAG: hypothetical protein N3A72_04550 [bacterium]|nr:hypothetical protein [bacterium]
MLRFISSIQNLMVEWGPEAKINKIAWGADAAKGFAGIGLIAFGLVLALVFQKKIGWLIAVGGGVLLLVLFKVISF